VRRVGIAAVIGALVVVGVSHGQYRGRRGPANATARAGGIQGLVVTFRGSLKKLTKKELLIQSDENQLMTIRCSGKTKFLDKDNKAIKPSDIDLETVVSVDASEDLDSKLMAVMVRVVVAPAKSLGK
jgi:hypothetical protein